MTTDEARTAERARRAEHLAACLERARAGQTDALDPVVRELDPLLWHVARGAGLDADEAADVVQTAWLELVRRLDEIREPAALAGWLVAVTKHEAWRVRTRVRRAAPTPTDALPDSASDDPEPVAGLLAGERARSLWHSFVQLPQRCQQLLRAVAMVERPDYAQVSAALGMPHGSIGPTRGRCLDKLRTLLLADPLWSEPEGGTP